MISILFLICSVFFLARNKFCLLRKPRSAFHKHMISQTWGVWDRLERFTILQPYLWLWSALGLARKGLRPVWHKQGLIRSRHYPLIPPSIMPLARGQITTKALTCVSQWQRWPQEECNVLGQGWLIRAELDLNLAECRFNNTIVYLDGYFVDELLTSPCSAYSLRDDV